MPSSITGQSGSVDNQIYVDEEKIKKNLEVQATEKELDANNKKDTDFPSTGDVVSISEAGAKQASHDTKSVDLPDGAYTTAPEKPEGSETLTIASTTMSSGRTVVVDKIWKPNKEAFKVGGAFYGYQASIFGADGELEGCFTLKKDTIINEGKDGKLNINDYVKGDETEGDDLIIGLNNKDLSGGDGNDTIVELSGDYNEEKVKTEGDAEEQKEAEEGKLSVGVSIDGGSGNDRVFVHGGRYSNVSFIDTGSGDDSVKYDRAKDVTIDTGSGDDSITAGVIYQSTVRTGSGDDKVQIDRTLDKKDWEDAKKSLAGVYESDVDLGEGDDQIEFGALRASNLETGTGSDVAQGYAIDYSSTVKADGDLSVRAEFIDDSKINVSGGSLNIKASFISKATITTDAKEAEDSIKQEGNSKVAKKTSKGTKIEARDIQKSKISTGRGNDFVSAAYIRDSNIETGDGADSIYVKEGVYKSKVYTGAGSDTVKSREYDRSVLDTGSGSDKASVDYIMSDSIVSLGDGDDTLNCYVSNSFVDFGSGNDVLNAYAITSSIISGVGSGSKINLVKGFSEKVGSWNGIVGNNIPDEVDSKNELLCKILDNYNKWRETGEYNIDDGEYRSNKGVQGSNLDSDIFKINQSNVSSSKR